jgi:excisionase family DNA binding protein
MKPTIHRSERLLTLDEIAEQLGVDKITVYYRLLSHEDLPAVKVGKPSLLEFTVNIISAVVVGYIVGRWVFGRSRGV